MNWVVKVVVYRLIWLGIIVALFLFIRSIVIWWDVVQEIVQDISSDTTTTNSATSAESQPTSQPTVDIQRKSPNPWSFDQQVNQYSTATSTNPFWTGTQTRTNAFNQPVWNAIAFDPFELMYEQICSFSTTYCYQQPTQ